MAVRIREDGRILCAAMHPAAIGDTYIHDGLHYRLSVELGAIVTEPMECKGGRGGHAKHGEWWWRNDAPADAEIDWHVVDATGQGRADHMAELAQRCAAGAKSLAARTLPQVLRLDVVPLRALAVVVVHVLLDGVERFYLRHSSPPFPWNRSGAYSGTSGVVA